MTVYIAPEVADVLALHPYLRDAKFRALSICQQLETQAETIFAAFQASDPRLRMHVMCWWPGARGLTLEDVLAANFQQADANLTIAREYGFKDWSAVQALGDLAPDPIFEAALDQMLDGDLAAFNQLLERHPTLATDRSRYGHRATLLHHISANGVESHRQVTPINAPALAKALMARGASRTAHAEMYGGGQTALMLAETSAHPLRAGVSEDLNKVLRG